MARNQGKQVFKLKDKFHGLGLFTYPQCVDNDIIWTRFSFDFGEFPVTRLVDNRVVMKNP